MNNFENMMQVDDETKFFDFQIIFKISLIFSCCFIVRQNVL